LAGKITTTGQTNRRQK